MGGRRPRDDRQPFPLHMDVEFLDRLSEPVREGRVASVSCLIRTALERFDFARLVVVRPPQLTISVRLPPGLRRQLRQVARAKGTSIGQLVRAAIEAYLPQVEIPPAGGPPAPPPVPSRRAPRPRRRL